MLPYALMVVVLLHKLWIIFEFMLRILFYVFQRTVTIERMRHETDAVQIPEGGSQRSAR